MDHSFMPLESYSAEDSSENLSGSGVRPEFGDNVEETGFLSVNRLSCSGDEQHGATLTWRDLSVYITSEKKKGFQAPFKRILNNVRGALQPGALVALMGASGAGKSTLLNALAYRCPPGVVFDGDIRVNGRLIDRSFCDISGYIYQDDLFVGSMTTREHLTFNARLKMSKWSKKEQDDRINDLLEQLGLMKCQHAVIGIPGVKKGLSGGERKRLSFASQILTDPSVLFCDEPTTGLDAFSAERLVLMLKDLTRRGKTVVCTIHQPSSETFALFDRLVLLAEGRIAYQGPTNGALTFLESVGYKCPPTYNPADFYVQTMAIIPGMEDTSRATIRAVCDRFTVTSTAKQIDLLIQYESSLGRDVSTFTKSRNGKPPKTMETAAKLQQAVWPVQFVWLLWRGFIDSYRNPGVHILRIIQKTVIALLAGLCFHGQLSSNDQRSIVNTQGALFILTTETTFPALYGALSIFPTEWPVFMRESRNGLYSPTAYYLSKVLALIPGYVIETFIFVTIAYWLMGLRPEAGAFFKTCLVLIVTCNTAAACGTFFSAAFESISLAISVLIPFDYILFITGGVLISLNSLPVYAAWTKYLSWFLYTNEALSNVQWDRVENIKCEDPVVPCLETGLEVLNNYSFDGTHFSVDVISMVMIYLVFHTLGFFAVIYRSRS